MPSAWAEPVPKPESTRRKAVRGKQRAYAMEKKIESDLRAAGDPGAKRSLASGAYKGVGQDGDVQAKDFLVEAKNYTPRQTRGGTQLTLELNWLYGENGVMAEAKLHDKPGVVVFQPKGKHYKVVVMDYDQFVTLFQKWNGEHA